MTITDQTITYVAALAKLELGEGEREKAKQDLQQIIGYMDRLNELDTEGVEPMTHVFSQYNVFRDDEVRNGDDRASLLANAPKQKDGCFIVPVTVE